MGRHFQQSAERQALDEAMAQALAVTIAWLTPDKDQADHLATLLGAWLQREAMADQLYEELGECYLLRQETAKATHAFAQAYTLLSQDTWLVANEGERLARIKMLGQAGQ